MQERAERYFRDLQSAICRGLASADGAAVFGEDLWSHSAGSGGGVTRVIAGGKVFEKGGVNFSAVRSRLSETIAAKMGVPAQEIFACGISLVLHPASPMVPTIHMNLRYLRLASGDAWFGGGTDLTPWYLFEEDARHFHRTLRDACLKHPACASYEKFKSWCDEYFFLKHRAETRGIGGLFFDYQRNDPEALFAFVQELGNAFLPGYLPIVERRKAEPWGAPEKRWQLLRRGRYVEFNLVYDRGTLFGLETGGRTESILMSLPPEVAWEYNAQAATGSREAELLAVLRQPQSWI